MKNSIKKNRKTQKGMMLLEALVAIIIFMLGIVGIVGLGAKSIAWTSDAQYRLEANNYANQIAQSIWLNVQHKTPAALKAALADYAHNTTGAPSSCAFSGDEVVNDEIKSLLDDIKDPSKMGLPGATAAMQQITVDTSVPGNQVVITLCWRGPKDAKDVTPRVHQLISYIN